MCRIVFWKGLHMRCRVGRMGTAILMLGLMGLILTGCSGGGDRGTPAQAEHRRIDRQYVEEVAFSLVWANYFNPQEGWVWLEHETNSFKEVKANSYEIKGNFLVGDKKHPDFDGYGYVAEVGLRFYEIHLHKEGSDWVVTYCEIL